MKPDLWRKLAAHWPDPEPYFRVEVRVEVNALRFVSRTMALLAEQTLGGGAP